MIFSSTFLPDEVTEGERLTRALSRQLSGACELESPDEVEDAFFLSALCMDELALLRQEGAVSGDEFDSASEIYVQLHMALHQQREIVEQVPSTGI